MPIVKTLLEPLRHGQLPRGPRSIPRRYYKSWGYQDDEKRYFMGTFPPPALVPHRSDRLYVVEAGDIPRPDLISYKLFKDPAFFWVILWLNGISDPFEGIYPGMTLRVPTARRLAEFGIK